MKVSKKESPTEDSPVLLQLQRRHTMAEVDKNVDHVRAIASKTKSRSNSVSSSDTTQNSSQATTEFQAQKSVDNSLPPDGNQTSISTASTVVITESELSSSWLYKNKKAQMNTASQYESTCNSSAPLAPAQEEQQPATERSPMIQRPIKQKSGMNHRSKSATSCCFYTTALCIICWATIGILAAIASIIYLEIFSTRNSTKSATESNFTNRREIRIHDLIPMQKIGNLLINENETIQNGVQEREDVQSSDTSELSNSEQTQEKNSSYAEIEGVDKENRNKDLDETVKSNIDEVEGLLSTIINGTGILEESIIDRVTNHAADGLFEAIESNVKSFLNLSNFNTGSQKDESPYSKLFQLYNLHNTEPKNLTTLEDSEPEDYNVMNSRNIVPVKNADFNQIKLEDKSVELVPENELVLKHNSDTEKNKTADLELLSTESSPHDPLQKEKEEILISNSDTEQDKVEYIELLPAKSSQHNGIILEEESVVPDLKSSEHQQGKPENVEPFISESHDQIVETNDSELKVNTENGEIKTDDLDSLLNKSSHQNLLKKIGNQMEEFKEINTQEQNLPNDTRILSKPFEFNQPIVGANVAMPSLIELFKKSNVQEKSLQNDTTVLSKPFGFNQPIVGANIAMPALIELFKKSNTKEQILKNDTTVLSKQSGFNQPIVGANVAIPALVDLFKKINTKEQNLKNDTTVLNKSLGFNQPVVGANVAMPSLVELFKKSNTQEQNLKNDTAVLSKPFGINQPIVGANVAASGPVDLFRRLMAERESSVKPQVRPDDHDRKFSLAQALASLRRLDVNNKLPSSRQKPMFSKPSQNPNNPPKIPNQEEDSEKSHYLENLRRKLYDN